MSQPFVATLDSAVLSTATTIAFGSQGKLTALANGAAYPYSIAGTRQNGSAKEYMIATADNGSGTLTVSRGAYGTAAISYAAGDALIKEDPKGLSLASSNVTSAASATPTGNVSTTEKAMGLGSTWVLTPNKTGNINIIVGGMVLNSTAIGSGTNVTGRYGTGFAPSNGVTLGLGTQFGQTQHFIGSTVAGQQGFIILGRITGQAIGVPLWFDISLLAVTSGGATVKDVQILAWEDNY